MKIRFSQLFFVLSQLKISVNFKILFSLMIFKEEIVILSFMYCFSRNTPTYLPKLSLICGGNVNYYKSVHHPIPTHGKREHPGNFQNELVSSPFS